MKTKNILFVCKWNRFRSKIAENYFNKKNKNKNIKSKSAGLFKGFLPLDRYQIDLAKKFGIKLAGKPQAISYELLKWQDIIVIISDDIPKSIFKDKRRKKKIFIWKFKDVKYGDVNGTKKLINNIIISLYSHKRRKHG